MNFGLALSLSPPAGDEKPSHKLIRRSPEGTYQAGRPWTTDEDSQMLQMTSFASNNYWAPLEAIFSRPAKELKARHQSLKEKYYYPIRE